MMGNNCKVLVTGANGFVGSNLVYSLERQNHITVVPCVRRILLQGPSVQNAVCVGEVNGQTDWVDVLSGVEVVIHVAARAHMAEDNVNNALPGYRQVNVNGTLNLASQAAQAGVRRFIFISSIGVNGNSNTRPFNSGDCSSPTEPYALSKWEAEQGLWRIQTESEMEVVIIRPPLVYGPNAPGNFGSLIRWIERGIPLPLGAIHNRRSLIGIDNLVDLITRCIDHPGASNQVLLAGDGEDLSTTELLRNVARAMEKPLWLVPIPSSLLQFAASLLGKKAMAHRLLGSLQIDISRTCELLDWKPPYTVDEGLRRCFAPTHLSITR